MISSPLTNTLRKDSFKWTTEAEMAFDNLKKAMTTTPVLALLNYSKTLTLESEASGRAIGAVLMQDGQPIAFLLMRGSYLKLCWLY